MTQSRKPLVSFDFDRTLAQYDGRYNPNAVGEPIPLMLAVLKQHLAAGHDCNVLTARVHPSHTPEEVAAARVAIQQWCRKYVGQELPITCMKDPRMVLLYDDRACGILPNTGLRADGKPHSIIL